MSGTFFKASFSWFCRNSTDPIAKRPNAATLYMWLCGLANCCEGTKPVGGEVVKAGQVLTGRADLAKLTGLSEQVVRTELRWLQDQGKVTVLANQQSNQRGTRVTICNWEEICGLGQSANQQPNHVLESYSSSEEYIPSTPPPKKAKASLEDEKLAETWRDYAVSEKPHLKVKLPEFAEAIRKLRELDGHSAETLTAVLAFVREDDFWRDKALSPAGLRGKSKSNGLPKIENVLSAMTRKKPAKVVPINRSGEDWVAQTFGRKAQ